MAQVLKNPAIKFTGADDITRMGANGKLQVATYPQPPGRYVPPPLRPRVPVTFSHSTHKKEYCYTS